MKININIELRLLRRIVCVSLFLTIGYIVSKAFFLDKNLRKTSFFNGSEHFLDGGLVNLRITGNR
jgi:hypothetical protein